MIGFYNINKPVGMGSASVVSKIKRITKAKCGHLGTLDPMATGVLPVAVGKATKLFDYFLNKDKRYFAIGKFGVLTDTLDSEGKVIKRDNKKITLQDINSVINEFVGEISQVPPIYSSVNVDGKRAYDIARSGKEIELNPRKINVYSLSAQEYSNEDCFSFEIHCSAGTYVRALIRDIAEKLGTVATTVCIIRTASGPFKIEDSYLLEDVENGDAKLIDIADVIDLPKHEILEEEKIKLLNGMNVKINLNDGESLCYYKGNIIGIVETKQGYSKIKINLWENV